MNDSNYSSNWYGSNKGDRQAILDIIGEFTTQNRLMFHLRADGQIGRIRVNLRYYYHGSSPLGIFAQRTKVLKTHMWRESPETYKVFPDQYDAAQELRRKLHVQDRRLTKLRNSYSSFIRDFLYDPIVERKGTELHFEALRAKLKKLTSVTPVNYRLKWDRDEWLEGDERYSYYIHPVA